MNQKTPVRDYASDRVDVPRQSLIKMWLAERLAKA